MRAASGSKICLSRRCARFSSSSAPALLFPFARRLVGDLTREGGFPPLLLDPIDFASLYRQRVMEDQASAEKTTIQ